MFREVGVLREESKAKRKLIDELLELRRRNAELEASETRTKQAEEELRRSRGYLDGILNAMYEGVMVIDRNYIIRAVNDYFLKEYDATEEETIGHTCYETTHKASKPCSSYGHPCPIGGVLNTRKPVRVEHIHEDDMGKEHIIEISGFPLFGKDGDVEQVIEVSHDITPRRQAEEALRKSEEMYRAIFQTSEAAAIMIEEDTTISLANSGFERVSGYSKEEVEGKKSWAEFVAKPEQLERMQEYHRLRRADPDAAPREYEFQFVNKAGEIRDLLIMVTMIPGTKRSVAFTIDITERKKEAERIQAAKMESLHQLVAGVAHEMNNPIGAITSNSDISNRAIGRIKEIIANEYPQEVRENRQLVGALTALGKMNQVHQTASEEIARIVANLQSFVRLDEAEWQYADIHEGMDNVIALMGSEFSGRIRVTRDYNDIPGIYCSPRSINQTFMNLFRNASEAIDGRGEISIRTSVQEGHVIIEITDTGKGIPAEDMDRIFDPGFTTKGVGVGMGLGLAICYKIIVDEHKGHIYVSSEPGKGTTLIIALPQHHDRT